MWLGPKIEGGYARASVAGRKWLIHRWLYEQLVGVVPDGMELDHLCRRPSCVNPRHLEPVTHRTNVLRGRVAEVQRERMLSKTECKRGHQFDAENTYIDGKGTRSCRTCRRAANRRWQAKVVA